MGERKGGKNYRIYSSLLGPRYRFDVPVRSGQPIEIPPSRARSTIRKGLNAFGRALIQSDFNPYDHPRFRTK